MRTLNIAISPCPNDTYIFDAMLHGKIDTEDLQFNVVFADVEELNTAAFKSKYDITKLSFHAYAYAAENYVLSRAGSALGNNCGPILISKDELTDESINTSLIAIPGKYTTANLLFSLRYPNASNKSFVLFSEIEEDILNSKYKAGLIIHENRFTYQEKGLKKIIDLGEYWEQSYKAPIPLGGIAIKRDLEIDTQFAVERIIQRSIQYAFDNPYSSKSFIRQYAQEMDDSICQQHINLYVNKFSLELGAEGEKAIQNLYAVAVEKGIIPEIPFSLFLHENIIAN